MQVTKIFRFEAAHRLFQYEGACANIHGHSYRLEVTVMSARPLDSLGMVIDFSKVKQMVNTLIIEDFDHAIILNRADPLVRHLTIAGGCSYNPKMVVMPENPTAENMIHCFYHRLADALIEDCVHIARIRLYETETSFAEKEWHL